MTNLAAIVVLLVLNGFFVAAEFSLVKARGITLNKLATNHSAVARLSLQIQAKLEDYLAVCQLGIATASLGLGWAGESTVAALLEPVFTALEVPAAALHTSALVLGFLLLVSLHTMIGNHLAKSFALRHAEQVALWIACPLHCAYLITRPFNWLLSSTSQAIFSLFGVVEAAQAENTTDAKSKNLTPAAADEDNIEQDEGSLLLDLIEFDQRCVACMMIPRKSVIVLDVAASEAINQRVLMESGHAHLPLIDSNNDDELLGVVSALVLYQAIIRQHKSPWQRLASYCEPPFTVFKEQHTMQLFDRMRTGHHRITCVVNDCGVLCGIITIEDLLEEVVGDT